MPAFTPLAADAMATAALSGLVTGIDMAATGTADQDIEDRTGVHIERDGRLRAAGARRVPHDRQRGAGRSRTRSSARWCPEPRKGSQAFGPAAASAWASDVPSALV